MPKMTMQLTVNGLGLAFAPPNRTFETDSGAPPLEIDLDPAEAGSLTTRTDADTGEITMDDGGHTIQTSDVVDVYWDGGVQYGCTVGTVSGTAVPIDLGSGDDLPAQGTAVTVVVQKAANADIDGDALSILVIEVATEDQSRRDDAHVQFVDSGDLEIAEFDLVTNVPRVFIISELAANPFTGNDIAKANLSTGGSTSGAGYKFKLAGLVDATP